MSKDNSQSGRIGIFGAMFLIFLTLKLTHFIDWSWWWVTAPLWGSVILVGLIIALAFLIDKRI